MSRQSNISLEKWTALYVRLSHDDETKGDSNSISHQIEILTKYAKTQKITAYKIYKDDGYSGTNFKRPAFQEMLANIEQGHIDCVIVKDMSRFGRNYLEVGMYTEIMFPEKNVRFVAVNDGVDSENMMDNDFTPFRNIINEWYAKDTSKKIRAVYRNKGMSGQRISTQIPYGYIKGENGTMIADEEAAPIVQLIFRLAIEGNSLGKIARTLAEQKIATPGTLAFQRTGCTNHYNPDYPFRWNDRTIAFILKQKDYLGNTYNFKTSRVSYKCKKTVFNPEDKQVVIENTHPAIIDQETWDLAQKICQSRKRPTRMGDMGLFSGIVFCADCGKKLYLCRTHSKERSWDRYICGTYSGRGREECSSHYIRAMALEQLVLENLRKVISYVKNYEDDFIRQATRNSLAEQAQAISSAKRQLEQQMWRITEIDNIIKRLYEDNVCGKLSDARFEKMSADYEQEQQSLEVSSAELKKEVETSKRETVNIKSFLKIVKKYTEPTELTADILHELVEKVVVHEADKSSGHRTQQIDIYYNFVGKIPLSEESYQK